MIAKVYTAVYGGYDKQKDWPIDVAIFNEERPEETPRMKAKYFKCNPHECLPEHDISIWIDGSATIHDSNFIERCINYLGQSDIMCFVHPEGRRCIYDEAVYCKDMIKYKDQDVMGQVDYYRARGYQEQMGLWACGLVVRRNNEAVKEFNKSWWMHNNLYTYQDQLSFPYLLHQHGLNMKTLWLDQLNNDLITFNTPHTSEN